MAHENLPCTLSQALFLFYWEVETIPGDLVNHMLQKLEPLSTCVSERLRFPTKLYCYKSKNKLLFEPLYIFQSSTAISLAYYISCLIQLLSLCAEVPTPSPFVLNLTANQKNKISTLKFKQPLVTNDTHRISGHSFRSCSQMNSSLAEPHFEIIWYIKIKQKVKCKTYKRGTWESDG